MLKLELSSIILEIPNDANSKLCWNLIGCSTLRQEYCKLIDWYWKVMIRQLGTLTHPIGWHSASIFSHMESEHWEWVLISITKFTLLFAGILWQTAPASLELHDAVGPGVQYNTPNRPPLQRYLEVIVSQIYNPSNFYIQVMANENTGKRLEELMDQLE